MSKRGKTQLCVNGYLYTCAKTTEELQYWTCNQQRVLGCSARASTGRSKKGDKPTIKLRGFHNHRIILERRKPGECAKLMEKYARERDEEKLPAKRKRLPRGATHLPVECILATENQTKSPKHQ